MVLQDTGIKSATFGLENAGSYGTTREKYKLWVDYIFDWFGATLERRLRRYAVSAAFATLIWLIGFVTFWSVGLTTTYIETPGVYLFWIGIAWCFNALRWLSQTYHLRTNPVRVCFPEVDDEAYQERVHPFAHNATRNKEIFIRSVPYAIVVWIYVALTFYSSGSLGQFLLFVFPRAFPPTWYSGDHVLIKMLIYDLYWSIAIVHVYTGARLTRATAPLYSALSQLPVIPVPGLVSEMFQGVLDLYLTGAGMWSFGIILAELLYNAQLDFLSLAFVFTVTAFGIFAYLVPRRAVRKIWVISKERAISILVRDFTSNIPGSYSSELVSRLNSDIQSIVATDLEKLDRTEIFNLVLGQILPSVPLFLNSLVIKHIPF